MAKKEKIPEDTQQEDKLTIAIGEFGKWQILLLALVISPIKMIAAWNQMGIIFLAPETNFKCLSTSNSSDIVEMSTCYSDCVQYEYYTSYENTIISEWNLICGNEWLANFTQTVLMFGVLLGSIIFGYIADRHGRRPALLTACLLQLAASIATPFCPDYWSFTTIRFLIGFATAGTMLCSFIVIMEVTGPKKRELVNCLAAVPLPVGEMIMPIFSFYLRAWNRISLGFGLANLVFVSYFWLLPESPKWLISVGRLEEAGDIMRKAAICNKQPAENIPDTINMMKNDSRDNNKQQCRASYVDLVVVPSLRMKNLCSCVCWFILGLSFYGSNQYIGQTSSNAFISIVMAGALQIPGILISCYLCKRFGRRKTLIGLFVMCAISNGLLAAPLHWFYFKLVVGSFGMSAASGAFSTMYMYTTELFPTVTRNMAMGASSTISRVGSMLAPFVAGGSPKWLPPAVFAVAPVLAIVACWQLPETRGKTLDNVIEEKTKS